VAGCVFLLILFSLGVNAKMMTFYERKVWRCTKDKGSMVQEDGGKSTGRVMLIIESVMLIIGSATLITGRSMNSGLVHQAEINRQGNLLVCLRCIGEVVLVEGWKT